MRRKSLRFPNGIPRAMSDNPPQADINPVTVTDNSDLRDHIAELLELLRPVTPVEAADAVIAALKLRRASRPNDYDHRNYPPGDRYITDWIPNG